MLRTAAVERVSRRRARLLLPLVLATIATQATLFTLVPLVVAVGEDLDASVSAVGQARSILSITAVLVVAGASGR